MKKKIKEFLRHTHDFHDPASIIDKPNIRAGINIPEHMILDIEDD